MFKLRRSPLNSITNLSTSSVKLSISDSVSLRVTVFLRVDCHYTWWNRELTLKYKLKCHVKPMKDPLGVSPSKENQGTTRGKQKYYFDLGGNRTHNLRIRSTVTLPIKLRVRTEKVGDDLGGESRRR